ncbi:hypothetical protein AGMMS49587_06830 [Spirochaetia bacterium]|nr:hypothetical protein AGMMS49587_06830 [Spirochaetia bacterium]
MNNDSIILEGILDSIKQRTDELTESQFRIKAYELLLNGQFKKKLSKKSIGEIADRFTELWEKYKTWYDEESTACELE